MSDKRFEIRKNINGEYWLFDNKYDKAMMISKIRATLLDVCNMLNEQQSIIEAKDSLLSILAKENEQLRTQLLICQQSKNDDGRFKVWEVPPIPKGTNITFSTTTERDGENE